jgi:hypothetical protein
MTKQISKRGTAQVIQIIHDGQDGIRYLKALKKAQGGYAKVLPQIIDSILNDLFQVLKYVNSYLHQESKKKSKRRKTQQP